MLLCYYVLFSNDETASGINKQLQNRAPSHFSRHSSSLSLVQNVAVDICFVSSDSKPEAADDLPSTAQLQTRNIGVQVLRKHSNEFY